MNAYHIYCGTSGHYFGMFYGADEAAALEEMARDAGYRTFEEACEVSNGRLSDLIINEAE